jgi:hypothetical protein
MSKITLTHENKEYILEYSRQSVKTMESQGFNIDQIDQKPATMIPLLFEGAFIKNCRGVKRKEMDEIYEGIKDKGAFVQALGQMCAETLSTLLEDNPEGNVSWAMTR